MVPSRVTGLGQILHRLWVLMNECVSQARVAEIAAQKAEVAAIALPGPSDSLTVAQLMSLYTAGGSNSTFVIAADELAAPLTFPYNLISWPVGDQVVFVRSHDGAWVSMKIEKPLLPGTVAGQCHGLFPMQPSGTCTRVRGSLSCAHRYLQR